MDKELKKTVKDYYIKDGVGVIRMKVDELDDVLCGLSVIEGYECIGAEVIAYLNENAKFIDKKYPIRLEIVHGELTDREKRIIENTIRDELTYSYYNVEKQLKNENDYLLYLLVAMLISYVLYYFVDKLPQYLSLISEIIPVAFSLFATNLVSEFFISRRNIMTSLKKAKQMADMEIVFIER